ncbi:type II toxin-antitoxin system VapC family toxin [Methylomonas sp. MgM2]
MLTICDTHILLFWADAPHRLSATANAALKSGIESENLACSDISLWEIAMLYTRGRINNQAGVSSSTYIEDILLAMNMSVLPITAEIAELSQSDSFMHGDPADRLIAATALAHRTQLITSDEKLRSIPELRCVW